MNRQMTEFEIARAAKRIIEVSTAHGSALLQEIYRDHGFDTLLAVVEAMKRRRASGSPVHPGTSYLPWPPGAVWRCDLDDEQNSNA
jgi:hypothetical protein